MAARNRAIVAANLRKECEGLYEIDRSATRGNDKNLTPQELTNLNMPRTGSAWYRNTAFWAGQSEEQEWTLCGEKEDIGHGAGRTLAGDALARDQWALPIQRRCPWRSLGHLELVQLIHIYIYR